VFCLIFNCLLKNPFLSVFLLNPVILYLLYLFKNQYELHLSDMQIGYEMVSNARAPADCVPLIGFLWASSAYKFSIARMASQAQNPLAKMEFLLVCG